MVGETNPLNRDFSGALVTRGEHRGSVDIFSVTGKQKKGEKRLRGVRSISPIGKLNQQQQQRERNEEGIGRGKALSTQKKKKGMSLSGKEEAQRITKSENGKRCQKKGENENPRIKTVIRETKTQPHEHRCGLGGEHLRDPRPKFLSTWLEEMTAKKPPKKEKKGGNRGRGRSLENDLSR